MGVHISSERASDEDVGDAGPGAMDRSTCFSRPRWATRLQSPQTPNRVVWFSGRRRRRACVRVGCSGRRKRRGGGGNEGTSRWKEHVDVRGRFRDELEERGRPRHRRASGLRRLPRNSILLSVPSTERRMRACVRVLDSDSDWQLCLIIIVGPAVALFARGCAGAISFEWSTAPRISCATPLLLSLFHLR